MWINKIKIKNFRAFSNSTEETAEDEFFEIPLGKNITCLAGHNGIGKSTVLALLSNCGELKTGKGKHLNGSPFRGEYSQIIKGDKNFDSTGEKCTLFFSDVPSNKSQDNPFVNELSFRATFQQYDKREITYNSSDLNPDVYTKEEILSKYDRYRLIPQKIEGIRDTEKKLEWPTYYLGLSRLFPIGESEDANQRTIKETILQEILVKHRDILNSRDSGTSAKGLNLTNMRKKGFGIETEKYGSLANSSGQDNLGQILLTIASFRELKKLMKENYHGGIFLIDEMDATLHPSAQNKLFDYLKNEAKKLGIQIVFTTHSLSLIEHIIQSEKLNEKNEQMKMIYCTNNRSKLEIKVNPDLKYIQNDMLNTYNGIVKSNSVEIFTEDSVARWFLKGILKRSDKNIKLNFIEINFGWEQLVELFKSDYIHFSKKLLVLDSDINEDENRTKLHNMIEKSRFRFDQEANDNTTRILALPGKAAIEKIFWEYLFSLEDDDKFYFDPRSEALNLSKRAIIANGPFEKYEYQSANNNLNKIKRWFEDNSETIDILFDYWYTENEDQITEFLDITEKEYLKILSRNKGI